MFLIFFAKIHFYLYKLLNHKQIIIHIFFYKNIKTEGRKPSSDVLSFFSFKPKNLNMFFFFSKLDISWKIPHQSFKMKLISFSKP